jgi:predicted nucleic acid-binding Zn ribbon protein
MIGRKYLVKKFSDVMKEFNNARNFRDKLEEVRALEAWEEVITDDISKNTSPKHIRNGILYVKTKSPTWAQELSGFSPRLREMLNEFLGAAIVREIKFSCEVFRAVSGEEESTAKPELGGISIDEHELKAAVEATAPIHDIELRERLSSLIIQSKKLNRWRDTEGWTVCAACGRQIPAVEKGCRRCLSK